MGVRAMFPIFVCAASGRLRRSMIEGVEEEGVLMIYLACLCDPHGLRERLDKVFNFIPALRRSSKFKIQNLMHSNDCNCGHSSSLIVMNVI